MEGAPGDLQTKYHKIAGEYSKLRAQVAVLKKAVIDEQATNNELKEALRVAEQSLRKADQEADSLNFRNEQLTRRVTVLQNELDTIQNQNRNKKSKGKSHEGQQPSEFVNNGIDEEFLKKIRENARLLSLMEEKEDEHRQEVANLTAQLDKVSLELSQLHKSSSEAEEKCKTSVTKLERELQCMREGQQELSSISQECAQLRSVHDEYKAKMEAKVNRFKAVISSHLPFIDSINSTLTSLNVPKIVNSRGSLTSRAGEDLRAALQQLAASLALWHKVTECRLQKLPNGNSAINTKYCSSVRETGTLALELEHSLSPSKMCKTVAQRLPSQLSAYCGHLETLLVHQRLSVEEEGEFDEQLIEINRAYLDNSGQLVSQVVHINASVTMYKSMQHSAEARQKHQRGLITLTSLLQDCFKDLFNVFVLKSGTEAEASWATEESIAANQSVINSLSSLVECSERVAKCMSELWKSASATPIPHPLVSDLRRRGVHYLNTIYMDEAPSVPYIQAIKDHEVARNSGDVRDRLLTQLEESRERLVHAEQEREALTHDLQLLHFRFNEDKAETSNIEDISKMHSRTVTDMLGLLELPIIFPKEVDAREKEIKQYFRRRINKLIEENVELQSKSATLLAESAALARRLESSVSNSVRLEEARERLAHLQEEVTTTVTNYEAQLSTMSDHLATMNEKLAQQKDTIDQLEYQIANKKKGKK